MAAPQTNASEYKASPQLASLNVSLKGRRFLVTGAFGLVGHALTLALVRAKADQVVLFDIRNPGIFKVPEELLEEYTKRTKQVLGDVRSKEKVIEVSKGVDTVFHVASFGMSGIDMLNKKLINEVNVGGTQNIIDACVENGIQNLVYTSSYNAVFHGQKLSNVRESEVPYPPLHLHCDEYSRTKSIAEQLVLSSEGKSLSNKGTLRTVALRPAAIYGPGEQRHLQRLLETQRRGFLFFSVGPWDAKYDWVYVDNLVFSYIQAAIKLAEEPSPVRGKAFAISDCRPMHNFDFFAPFFKKLGYGVPKIAVPTGAMLKVAHAIEFVHDISPVKFVPFATRAEVNKIGVEHYFNPEAARRDLGYNPIVSYEEGIDRTAESFHPIEQEWRNKTSFFITLQHILIFVLILFLNYLFHF